MSEPVYKTVEEMLADPATTPEQRLRIQADMFGDALFEGLRKHAKRLGLPEPLDDWWEMTAFQRGSYWRPAIYEMLKAMKVPPL